MQCHPFLPRLPPIGLGIFKREPASPLISARATADARLLAAEQETPGPKRGERRAAREPEEIPRLPRLRVPRPAVERRRPVVQGCQEEDWRCVWGWGVFCCFLGLC